MTIVHQSLRGAQRVASGDVLDLDGRLDTGRREQPAHPVDVLQPGPARRPGRTGPGWGLGVQGVQPDPQRRLEQLGAPGADAEPTARAEHPPQVPHHAHHVGDQEDADAAHDGVEPVVGVGDVAEVGVDERHVGEARRLGLAAGDGELGLGEVDPDHRSARRHRAGGRQAGVARPAGEIEHPAPGRETAAGHELDADPLEERERVVVEVVGGRVERRLPLPSRLVPGRRVRHVAPHRADPSTDGRYDLRSIGPAPFPRAPAGPSLRSASP
jgi:hypothetical protein